MRPSRMWALWTPLRSRAAVRRAEVVIRPELTDGPALLGVSQPLFNQLPQHRDETGMHVDCCGSVHRQAEFGGGLFRFLIEVVEHFEMVGEKPDR